jgi:tungstate transport system ATP-binding protein
MTGGILPGRLEAVSYTAGGRQLVEGVDLAIAAGPLSVILGPNGAGKSLLLRLAHGLLAPSAGRVVWQSRQAQRRQAMVFQRPVLLRRSVAGNIDYALALRSIRGEERRRRRDAALAETGLTALARQPARALSGGEQQRLALARVWALAPEVLFLDEPTANLDPAATRAVEEIVRDLQGRDCKIVLTTHDLGQARRLADEVVFLHRGRLVEQAPAERFFAAPASAEAAAFLDGKLLW